MDLLTIRHKDFILYIECANFDATWYKAKNNLGEDALMSTYSWSDGVESVVIHNDSDEITTINKGEQAQAIFFDNTDYPIWVEFNDHVNNAQWGSDLQSDNEKFSFRRHTLAGYINYGNDIGRSEIKFIYKVGKETCKFCFSFEVLSSKLDYHKHWKAIIEDIEHEYRMLSRIHP